MTRATRALLSSLLWLIGALPAGAADPVLLPPPEGVTARQLAQRAEDALRSARTIMRAEMTVISPRLAAPRVVAFESWEDRDQKRSFIRIESPAKDAGTGFLKLHPNLWMHIPRVERTIRIPPSMMLQPWMGSDFSNDDLIKESSALDDYDHTLLGLDPAPEGHEGLQAYVVEYRPHEDAAVVWGKIITWIETRNGTPLRQDFHDEDGVLLRTMRFYDIRRIGARFVPFVWLMKPLDKQGHETRIELETIEFDASFDDDIFTRRNLEKARR